MERSRTEGEEEKKSRAEGEEKAPGGEFYAVKCRSWGRRHQMSQLGTSGITPYFR